MRGEPHLPAARIAAEVVEAVVGNQPEDADENRSSDDTQRECATSRQRPCESDSGERAEQLPA